MLPVTVQAAAGSRNVIDEGFDCLPAGQAGAQFDSFALFVILNLNPNLDVQILPYNIYLRGDPYGKFPVYLLPDLL